MDRPLDTTGCAGARRPAGPPADARRHLRRRGQYAAENDLFSRPAAFAKATRLASDDGLVSYDIAYAGSRLVIKRTQRTPADMLVEQCVLIPNREAFHRWCAAEPTRFQDPILFDRLRRRGNEHFDRGG